MTNTLCMYRNLYIYCILYVPVCRHRYKRVQRTPRWGGYRPRQEPHRIHPGADQYHPGRGLQLYSKGNQLEGNKKIIKEGAYKHKLRLLLLGADIFVELWPSLSLSLFCNLYFVLILDLRDWCLASLYTLDPRDWCSVHSLYSRLQRLVLCPFSIL